MEWNLESKAVLDSLTWGQWNAVFIHNLMCQYNAESTTLSLYNLKNHHRGTVEHFSDANGLSHCFPTVQCQDRGQRPFNNPTFYLFSCHARMTQCQAEFCLSPFLENNNNNNQLYMLKVETKSDYTSWFANQITWNLLFHSKWGRSFSVRTLKLGQLEEDCPITTFSVFNHNDFWKHKIVKFSFFLFLQTDQ